MDPKDVLVISNHHRRSPYFERGMQKLWDSGFKNIWIQDTGNEAWGPYRGPCSKRIQAGHLSYDQGMVSFKRSMLATSGCETIFLIDNDCFIDDVEYLKKMIDEFVDGDYDFVGHPVQYSYDDTAIGFGDIIKPVDDFKILGASVHPGFIPSPHFENSYLLMSMRKWRELREEDVDHSRKHIRATLDLGGKFGIHDCDYRLTYTHVGPGWLHIGNLVAFNYALENGDQGKFDPESRLAMARLGFFFQETNKFGNCYPPHVMSTLAALRGLRRKASDAWLDLASGTFLVEE